LFFLAITIPNPNGLAGETKTSVMLDFFGANSMIKILKGK
jgi:hypothetical protein